MRYLREQQHINGADPGEMDIIVVADCCSYNIGKVTASFVRRPACRGGN
jgi:hypothetical protein